LQFDLYSRFGGNDDSDSHDASDPNDASDSNDGSDSYSIPDSDAKTALIRQPSDPCSSQLRDLPEDHPFISFHPLLLPRLRVLDLEIFVMARPPPDLHVRDASRDHRLLRHFRPGRVRNVLPEKHSKVGPAISFHLVDGRVESEELGGVHHYVPPESRPQDVINFPGELLSAWARIELVLLDITERVVGTHNGRFGRAVYVSEPFVHIGLVLHVGKEVLLQKLQ